MEREDSPVTLPNLWKDSMNVFAELARPILNRPGDFGEPRAKPKRQPVIRRMATGRPTNIELPIIPNPWNCTASQTAVLGMLVDGLDSREIASRLSISMKTVECHMERIRDRMGESSRVRCAILWDRFAMGRDESEAT